MTRTPARAALAVVDGLAHSRVPFSVAAVAALAGVDHGTALDALTLAETNGWARPVLADAARPLWVGTRASEEP